MRILLIHCGYRQTGGEDAVVTNLEAGLVRQGHEVASLRFNNSSSAHHAAAQLLLSFGNPFSGAALKRLIRTFEPDVAHVHNLWYAGAPTALRVLRRRRIPAVVTLHNYRYQCANGLLYRDEHVCTDCLGRSSKSGIIHRCYRGSALLSAVVAGVHRWPSGFTQELQRAAAVQFLTPFMRDVLAMPLGIDPSRAHVIANFVEQEDADCDPINVVSRDRFLFVGRLSSEKGIPELVRAWQIAQSLGLRDELVVAGDGPQRAVVESAAQRLDGIVYVGQVDATERRSLMDSARALVVPSVWLEGLPMVILEALSRGLPIIASDHGGMAEIALKGGGMVAKAGSPHAWAMAMLEMARLSPEELHIRSRAASCMYNNQFHESIVLNKLNTLYAEMLVKRESGC